MAKASTNIQRFSYSSYEEFLKIRHKLSGKGQPDVFRLGASDIGMVLGLNEFRSTIASFYEHCDYVPNRFQPTLDTHRGQIQEPVAYEFYWKYIDPANPDPEAYLANWYGPKKVYRTATKSNTIYLNEAYPHVFCSPDYEIDKNEHKEGNGVLEIKCPRAFVSSKYEAGISAEYVAQVQFQMFVGDFDYAEILSLEDATNPNLFFFDLIKESKERMLQTTREYQERVLAGKRIVYSNLSDQEKEQQLMDLAPDESNDGKYSEFLKFWHRAENHKEDVPGTEEQLDIVCDYLREKEHEAAALKLENQIREFFSGGVGRIDFGKDIGAISYRSKINIPKSILKNVEAYG
jgi:hypothetical protein